VSGGVGPTSGARLAVRLLLAFGVAAPALAIAATLVAMVAYPDLDPARQYLSELGGRNATAPLIFNAGVFVAGVMAALAGAGFGLGVVTLTGARAVAGAIAALFIVSGYGLTQAALFPWPDPRHLAVNLALGIQLAPLLLAWGLRSRLDLRGLQAFLMLAFAVMAVLTVLTKHMVLPRVVDDTNVGWWERGYAVVLVSWVGVAALLLDRCLRREASAQKNA
jgi:glucan biosynthesis protein C